ncbi:aspartate aminotransferase family protein [Nocardia sp. BMG51109]|uniref:aspartate aminotransferase family protein n=1 Tax=Nocardia sp. BMG51109 TaxID=1056816 RepID=UPI0004641018|nr:aminotransferase class III-fold pyridoxal phosphate-dependent enzyme [Nocardia sp. BMG51109]
MLDDVLDSVIADYVESRPRSAHLQSEAEQVIPGGTTRSVIAVEPFPFRVAKASGSRLEDVDGNYLIDFCGDYTAGLLGHDPRAVKEAVRSSLDGGWTIGAAHAVEIEAAQLVCRWFPTMASVRFTTSGTEANLHAIGVSLHHTRRDAVVVFRRGFHGSLLNFSNGMGDGRQHVGVNARYRFRVGEYNDIDSVREILSDGCVGCVLVEPMQGAGGCRPAETEFLRQLRAECDRYDTVLIFDEVMTSRLYPGGLQQRYGVTPDLTTLGKYIAGGLPFGAFGGRGDLMAHYGNGSDSLQHSGTFNNNVLTMSAVVAVLRDCLDPDDLTANNSRGDLMREEISGILRRSELPIDVTGTGSMFCFHSRDDRWIRWLFFELLRAGYYISPQGMVTLSLAVTDEQCRDLVASVESWVERARSVRSDDQGVQK